MRCVTSICLVLALMPACLAAQDEVARLVKDLGDETDTMARFRAYQALARQKPPSAVALMLRALPGWGFSSQSYAVSLLGSYPREISRPAWRRLLGSKSAFLGVCAAAALYRAGERDAVDHIVAGLEKKGTSASEKQMMLGRITGIDEVSVRGAVAGMLEPGISDGLLSSVLSYLLTATDRTAMPAVTFLLDEPQASDRRLALCGAFLLAMGETDRSAALAEVMTRTGAPDLMLLERFLLAAPRPGAKVLDAIAAMLQDEKSPARLASAIRILSRHRHAAAIPVLRRLLTSADAKIVKAALEGLLGLGGEVSPRELQRLLHGGAPEASLMAAEMLRRTDDLSGLDRVIELLSQSGPHRAEAARVLGGFRVKKAVDPLLGALVDPSPLLRRNAFDALARVLRSLFPYRRLDLASTGYRPEAASAARGAGLARIKAWWQAHRSRRR